MNFENLTDHPIVLEQVDGSLKTLPPSGTVARVERRSIDVGIVRDLDVFLVEDEYGDVVWLPPPKLGTVNVVSRMVAEHAPRRRDLVFPAHLIRDGGRIIRARALGQIARPENAALRAFQRAWQDLGRCRARQ